MKNIFYYFLIAFFSLKAQEQENLTKFEPLAETPLYPIPAEMTFEEYQDMNRRLSQAFLWSSIPIPGITHYYAGEKKKARQLFYIGAAGFSCMIAGIASMGEATFPDYDESRHVIMDQGGDNERWFERVPTSMEGDVVHYELKEIYKQSDGDGGGLFALGLLIIVGDLIYDRLKGISLIEKKRDMVRYKYGQKLDISLEPTFKTSNDNQIGMKLSFDLF